MAGKPLVLRLGDGPEIPVRLEKIDRSRLYGYVEVEALDDAGRRCDLATLAQDGHTLVGEGGRALAMLSPDGRWVDRKTMRPVDPEGRAVAPVPSTFAQPVTLADTATVDQYLEHSIRAVYQLDPVDEALLAPLAAELASGTIFRFPFSFRGGLAADVAFLLAGADGGLFMAIGQPGQLTFVGLENQSAAVEEDELPEEEEADFGML